MEYKCFIENNHGLPHEKRLRKISFHTHLQTRQKDGRIYGQEGTAKAEWVEDETELGLKDLEKLEGYEVTGDAENGFLFKVVLEDVEPGSYTITEKNTAIEGFVAQETSVTAGSKELAAGAEATIELSDIYEEATTGTLIFTKSVVGGVTQEEAEGALTFTVQNTTTGNYLKVTEEEGTAKAEWVEDETELGLKDLAKLEGYEVTADTIEEKVAYFAEQISKNDFPSDGLVLVYDDIAYGKSLGRTAKFPRDSIAFKWQDETKETILKEIEWSPSRTGLINPVAIFEPVELEGTTVSRASLHNISIMKNMQIGIGDHVMVYKANMIIPQIAQNLTRSGVKDIPETCPVCGGHRL